MNWPEVDFPSWIEDNKLSSKKFSKTLAQKYLIKCLHVIKKPLIFAGENQIKHTNAMTHNTIESMLYDFIVDNSIATEDEISLVTQIKGWNEESLNAIIWCRTAYHDAEQCVDCEPENYYMRDELKSYYGLDEDEEDEE